MVAVLNRHSVKLNIGKLSRKISDLELQRRKIFENIGQLKQARDKLICKLRSLPPESHINLPDDVERTDRDNANSKESRDVYVETSYKTDSVHDVFSAIENHSSATGIVSDEVTGQAKLHPALCSDSDEFWTAFATDLPEDAWADDDFEVDDMKMCDDIHVNGDKISEPIVISDDEEEETNPKKDLSLELCNVSASGAASKRDNDISNEVSDVVKSFSKFQFNTSSPSTTMPVFKKPVLPFKAPNIPFVKKPVFKRKPKSKQGKLFEMQHIQGECRRNKPVNSKADFDKAEYYLLRPSGKKGELARGRGLDEVKCVTKQPLPYSETGWKRNGVQGEALFVVTGKHDNDGQGVEPIHLDGKAEFTYDGKVQFQGQIYSQLSQTQCYV